MKVITGLIIVVIIALWSVWPMFVKHNRVADFGKDGMFLTAIQLNWHQKISDYIRHKRDPKMGFFDGYFFYSKYKSMAYSDMLFVSSLMTYFFAKLSNNMTGVSGVSLVMWQTLSMIMSFVILTKTSKNIFGSVLGTVAFGLSQIHFEYQVHLHTWNMTLWLLGFELFREKKYFLSGLFLGLQFWESPLGLYFGILLIVVQLISYSTSAVKLKNWLTWVFALVTIAFWPAKAYWDVSTYYNYVRTIRDAAFHGLSLNQLDRFVSPGLFLLFVFSMARISSKFKALSSKKSSNFKFLIILVLVSYILALGPVLKWESKTVKIGGVVPIPLPYAVAYYTIPGWQAFRVPSRWMVLVGWGMAGMIAAGIRRPKMFGGFVCLVVAIVGGTHIIKFVDLPLVVPDEYKKADEILEFQPKTDENKEIERMYFSILAGKKTLNGYSGFLPPERVKWLNEK